MPHGRPARQGGVCWMAREEICSIALSCRAHHAHSWSLPPACNCRLHPSRFYRVDDSSPAPVRKRGDRPTDGQRPECGEGATDRLSFPQLYSSHSSAKQSKVDQLKRAGFLREIRQNFASLAR